MRAHWGLQVCSLPIAYRPLRACRPPFAELPFFGFGTREGTGDRPQPQPQRALLALDAQRPSSETPNPKKHLAGRMCACEAAVVGWVRQGQGTAACA